MPKLKYHDSLYLTVECLTCGACGPVSFGGRASTAITAWNEWMSKDGQMRKSYLERLYSGEIQPHKWDGEKWIPETNA
jgi:hypothetical protein